MAKVRINSLPPGFTIKNGKVVKAMQKGGITTGDQYDYGLSTGISDPDKENTNRDINVRYSLNSVPRDKANIEAEGGETVLTDLDNDGLFGLYDIKGPRHSSGGVPLNLPEQSFVFSDTKAMKLGTKDLSEFDIKSRKKITPAKVSKKFDINPYYGILKDQYADDIQVRSAELMMDKNKRTLSKLAFMQEAKKNFEDGVPTASYPYLVEQGIDPIDFTAKVENISKERAQQRAIDALPPDQRAQVMMLQQLLAQADQGQQQMAQEPTPEDMVMGMARYGRELPKAQFMGELFKEDEPVEQVYGAPLPGIGVPVNQIPQTQPQQTQPQQPSNTGVPSRNGKPNVAVDPNTIQRYEDLGFSINTGDIGERQFANVQPIQGPNLYGDASSNMPGFESAWSGIYPNYNDLRQSLLTYKPSDGKYNNPGVRQFQTYYDQTYIPQRVQDLNNDLIAAGYDPLSEQQIQELTTDWQKDFGFTGQVGKGYDSKMGTFTSSRRPISWNITPKGEVEMVEETPEPATPPRTIPPGELGKISRRPDADFWLQDLLQLDAIANRDREMFFPFQPAVNNVNIGYVLEEPTRAIAATNERLGIQSQAAGAFSGPQSLAARTAQAQGQAAAEIANEVARVNQRNVGTINQGLAQQAQMDMLLDRERRDRTVKEYDDTQTVLQRYMDEKNYDREQYNMALTNAITNRANTYNLNSIQDYYQVDPTTGGMIGQFGAKAFEPAPIPSSYGNIQEYVNAARMLKAAGIEPTAELIQNVMGQVPITPQETNIQRAFRNMPEGFGYNYSQPTRPNARNGMEINDIMLPFYIGTIGG
jgi:hypothetical protein